MRAVIVAMLALGLSTAATASVAAPYRGKMTGAQFVRDMMAEPDGGPASFRRERAMGYLDGTMDATAGQRWCPAGKSVPHELNYVVAEEMQRLSQSQLKGDAATLALSVLGRLYPCRAKP